MDNRDDSKAKLLSYIRFNHIKPVLNTTMLYLVLDEVNYLEYEILDYNDINNDKFNYIDDTEYWINKGIIKSTDDVASIKGNNLTFIDFKLNHIPLTFNANGDMLSYVVECGLNNYIGKNYEYID